MKKPPSWIVYAAALGAIVLLTWDRMTKGLTNRSRSGSFFALANAIATAEGYGVPGAIPTVRNNPGDLKLQSSYPEITTFATPAEGWEALYKQLDRIREGQWYWPPTISFGEFASHWTATEQSIWANNVIAAMRSQGYAVTHDSVIGEVLS